MANLKTLYTGGNPGDTTAVEEACKWARCVDKCYHNAQAGCDQHQGRLWVMCAVIMEHTWHILHHRAVRLAPS
eukprot:2021476-Prymnesium_polylepis.2